MFKFNNYETATDYSWNNTIIARSFMVLDLISSLSRLLGDVHMKNENHFSFSINYRPANFYLDFIHINVVYFFSQLSMLIVCICWNIRAIVRK